MTYSDWREWLRALPWSLKWFVLLILIRPVLDIFYFVKEISPLLSPLNIIGVLTPILILGSMLSSRFPGRIKSSSDIFMTLWGICLGLNILAVVTLDVAIESVEIVTKIVTPFLLYWFVRHLVRSKRDLLGVITTFLYSTIVPFGMLIYEQLVSPLSSVVYTRGYYRYEGLYADVVSYAIYIIGAWLIVGYFFLERGNRATFGRRAILLVAVGSLTVAGLLSMHHTASWGVAAAILALLAFHSLGKSNYPAFFLILVLGVAGSYVVGDTIGERIESALATDIAVIEGDKNVDRAFHGRVSRWRGYIETWTEMPLHAKLGGVSLSIDKPIGAMLLSGIHSDYLRITFSTGLIGLIFYLMFYIGIFARSWRSSSADRFLIQGAMAIILLYSITTTPTLYAPLMYLAMSILAYGAILDKPGAKRVVEASRFPVRTSRPFERPSTLAAR